MRTILCIIIEQKKNRESRLVQSFDNEKSQSAREIDPVLKKRLIGCMKKISDANRRHARTLVLIYQGYKIGEICEKMNITKNAAYIILSRARSMLRICLEEGKVL